MSPPMLSDSIQDAKSLDLVTPARHLYLERNMIMVNYSDSHRNGNLCHATHEPLGSFRRDFEAVSDFGTLI